MAVFGGGFLGAGLLQGLCGLLRRHADAVVRQVDEHIAVRGVALDPQCDLPGTALGSMPWKIAFSTRGCKVNRGIRQLWFSDSSSI